MRLLSAGLGVILLTACSSTSPSRPSPVPSEPAGPVAQRSILEIDEYRAALEESWDHIQARSGSTLPAELADLDAMLSIDIPGHPSIDGAVRYFSSDLKPSIQESFSRSARYRSMIEKALRQEKLPTALAYLPVIESAYMPTLTSRAGARGLWQFMPATAREYGLRVDWWVDERNDPHKSTAAAARYLRDLHRMFDDWALALAAYNCGPGRVKRTLEREGVSTFWELLERGALPKETRGYVPTFFATILLASDPEPWGFRLRDPEPEPGHPQLEVEGPVTLDYVARVAELDPQLVRELNPQYHRGVLPPGRSPLRLPEGSDERIASAAHRLRWDDPTLPVSLFTVRRGDTLAKLAKMADTEPGVIAAMNGGRTPRPGEDLYLPISTTDLSERLARRRSPLAATYVVRKGDTLYSIARRHSISLAELVEMNEGLSETTTLRPGDRLQVATGKAVTAR